MSGFRYRIIQILLAAAFLVIVGRLAQFQILDGTKYKALRQEEKPTVVNLARGEIVDRVGKVLALDLNKYTLEYNPLDLDEDRSRLAAQLSQIFPFNKASLLQSKSSQTLAHNLSKEQARKIRELDSRLLYLRKIRSRFYPQDNLASLVLGYVDIYGKARQGLEIKFEDYLSKNPESRLNLSLDSRLQVFIEQALDQRVVKTEAQRGTAIVMKVKTGEILAWAVNPSFNPNKYFKSSALERKNWPLVDVYQPGSIFKIVTVASALDSGTIAKDYEFLDEGFLKVDNWKIKNHTYGTKDFQKEKLSLQGLFERSSNPFAAHLALKMGRETFYRYIRKFGFGEKTGIAILGETKGILHKFTKWRDSDTATTAMGQGAISVTPLQMLAAANVVANNGYWIKPTLMKINKDEINSKVKAKKVIEAEVASHISDLLTNSIDYNLKFKHAIAGRVKNLKVAGKTGTAEKIKEGGGYSKRNTVASFLGYMPANDPKYIVLVVVDDPETDGRWGDTVAGPLFNKIAAFVRDVYL